MDYSTGITHRSFWYLESKRTVEYMLEGLNRDELVQLSLNKNIYQVNSERRSKDIANNIYKRFDDFPENILNYFLNLDSISAKIFVLITILKRDKLFFEFMYEVYREHIILGNLKLEDKDFNIFFQNKSMVSEKVAKWKEGTLKKLQRNYLNFLKEAGILTANNEITFPFIDMRLKDLLIKNGYASFVYSITGER